MPIYVSSVPPIVIGCSHVDCRRKAALVLAERGVDLPFCDLIAVPGGARPLQPTTADVLAIVPGGKITLRQGSMANQVLLWIQTLGSVETAKIFVVITRGCPAYNALEAAEALEMQREAATSLAASLRPYGCNVEIVVAG